MVLADTEKERIKALFSDYIDMSDSKKAISEDINNAVKEAASLANVKPTVMRKVFSYLKKKAESSNSEELDYITLLTAELS